MSDEQLTHARVFLRPIANPMPLGFVGVAVATLVDAGVNFKWFSTSETHQAAVVILVFAPLTQVIACVFGFLARDPVASTGMGVQAAGWLTIGLLLLLTPAGSTSAVLGTLLFGAGAGLLLIAIVCGQSKLLPALVLATTATRWIVEGVYQTSGSETWQDASGVIGLVLCALALYTAFAMDLEDQLHRSVLPILRRESAKRALQPELAAQTQKVAAEAGVRSQL